MEFNRTYLIDGYRINVMLQPVYRVLTSVLHASLIIGRARCVTGHSDATFGDSCYSRRWTKVANLAKDNAMLSLL